MLNRAAGALQYLATGVAPGQPDAQRHVRFETVQQDIHPPPAGNGVKDDGGQPDVTQLSRDDVVIAVMGVTGAGKSTFISHFADSPVVIGHGLESCTSDVSIHRASVAGCNVFLVDTPGFDDTYRSDTEVLRDLAFWLTESYKEDIKLTGIVYLHPISSNRVGGAAMKNLRMFKRLCGDEGLGSVVLATTMWSNENPAEAVRREKELQDKSDFWGDMIRQSGSKVFRQDQGKSSAERIIQYLINRRRSLGAVKLDIQRDMVDLGMTLDQTAAAQEVQAEIEKERKKHERELSLLRREMAEAFQNADRDHQRDLDQAKADMEKKIAKGSRDLKALRVSRQESEKEVRDQAEEHRKNLEELDRKLKLNNDGPRIIRETKYVPEVILCNVM